MLRPIVLASLLLSMLLPLGTGCGQPDPKKGPEFNEATYNDPLKAMEGLKGTRPGTAPNGKKISNQ